MRHLQRPQPKRRLADVPKPVRQRWARRIRYRWAQSLARAMMRRILPITERKRRKALEQAFATAKHFAHTLEGGKMKGVSILFNIGLYLLIADRDIQAAKIDALTHPDEWSRKLHARIILLTIYEWDADKVSGRALRDGMDQMLIPEELKNEASASLRRLRKIQEKATAKFASVRNATIAHRDPNALIQYRAIRDLDVQEVMGVAIEFFDEVGTFISVLTRLMAAGDTLPSYLRQWSASMTAEEMEHALQSGSGDRTPTESRSAGASGSLDA
jgi:hypothetical protein